MWINWKRRVKRDLLVQEDKNTWKIEAENQQKNLDWIGRGEKVRKSLKWSIFYKSQLLNFDYSKIRFDRSKNIFDWSSINQASIEPNRFRPKFLLHFQSVERQIQLIENLEKSNFWKTKHLNVETSQSTKFHEWNACVWD